MRRVMLFALWAVALVAFVVVGLYEPAAAQTRGSRDVDCYLTTTATTSTLVTGCEAPPPGQAIYITDISVYGDIITAVTTPAQVQSGTGGTCSSPKVHYACQHPATNGCEHTFETPVRSTGEVCLLDATVGTKWVSIKGYIGPK